MMHSRPGLKREEGEELRRRRHKNGWGVVRGGEKKGAGLGQKKKKVRW